MKIIKWLFLFLILNVIFAGCSKSTTSTTVDKKQSLKKNVGDWVLAISSNRIYQVTSVIDDKVTVVANQPYSNSNKGFDAYYQMPMDDLHLLDCKISEDSLSIINIEDDSKKLLLIHKGDHIYYSDSIHQEKYAFEDVKTRASTRPLYYTVSLRSLNGELSYSNFLHKGRGRMVDFHNILNLFEKTEKKYFKERLLKYPFYSTLTWIDKNDKVQKALTTTPQMESDSLNILMYSNLDSGKRIVKNILPEDYDFISNNTPSYHDTIRMLIDTTWQVPDIMFDYTTEDCSKLLLKENQTVTIGHNSKYSDMQFFSFLDGIRIAKQNTTYNHKAKMGYQGDWQLIDGKLFLQIEGEGSYYNKKTKSEIRTKWNHLLEFEIIDASKSEIKLKTKSITSKKL